MSSHLGRSILVGSDTFKARPTPPNPHSGTALTPGDCGVGAKDRIRKISEGKRWGMPSRIGNQLGKLREDRRP